MLEDYESKHSADPALVGRVLRVRLLAHERLGRIEEATASIPRYIASDPTNAGPTLQSLYKAMVEDIEKLEASGDGDAASAKAAGALLLAEQIDAWAQANPDVPVDRRILRLQLAEACLRAERYEKARSLFAQYLGIGLEGTKLEDIKDLRGLSGYAESLYHLRKFADALPIFNRLATGLPVDNPQRWRMLLRDLQCRTRLKEPPADIIRVIEQQRFLHPELGDPQTADEFEKLLRENRRRQEEP